MIGGYYVLEPEQLDPLLQDVSLHDMATAIQSWVIGVLYRDFQFDRSLVDIAVIRVNYCGEYPAIGIRGTDEHLVRVIEKKVHDILSSKSITDFITFICRR